jgi:hypothetical protein
MTSVKRLQIMIEEDLDAALGVQAEREGVSKAALVRRYVGERLKPLPLLEQDPLWQGFGIIEDGDPDSSKQIDEVVYGRGRE